ncbi:putative restriction endonuclease [Prosthecobacter debontii]|uniref:Putative restriction endonuclease n=1 Tax=Prosthecobacter debontii TaxID=48467 RepID=A0A1T4Z238_9BACT|nr:HNH endonuclease [Prosthecobacter debontii]SKB08016.1 putative restriction endonuclease [Prosthecobacter debontii]
MPFNRIQYAALAWPVLTRTAAERGKISYKELAESVGVHWRQCRLFLESIQTYCIQKDLPPLTGLVVRKSDGLPGHGFIAWDIDNPEEAYERVYAKDWSEEINPFDFAAFGETEELLAHKLILPVPDWEAVYRKVEDRGMRQVIFRKALLQIYGGQCAMSDCRAEDLLEAAHIAPWSECTPQEKLDVRNGLLLASTYHDLFDKGWITVNENYRVIEGPDFPRGLQDRFVDWVTRHVLGRQLRMPADPRYRPLLDYIQRRNDG